MGKTQFGAIEGKRSAISKQQVTVKAPVRRPRGVWLPRRVKKQRVIKNCCRRGEWAELVFMARAAEMGFKTFRTSENSAKYDVVVEMAGRFVRVQVKTTICCRHGSYVCGVHPNRRTRPYQRTDFDFIAAYVIPEDAWYIIPARLVVLPGRRGWITLAPSLMGHKWEPYLEAWELLKTGSRRLRKKSKPPLKRSLNGAPYGREPYHIGAVTSVTENFSANE